MLKSSISQRHRDPAGPTVPNIKGAESLSLAELAAALHRGRDKGARGQGSARGHGRRHVHDHQHRRCDAGSPISIPGSRAFVHWPDRRRPGWSATELTSGLNRVGWPPIGLIRSSARGRRPGLDLPRRCGRNSHRPSPRPPLVERRLVRISASNPGPILTSRQLSQVARAFVGDMAAGVDELLKGVAVVPLIHIHCSRHGPVPEPE